MCVPTFVNWRSNHKASQPKKPPSTVSRLDCHTTLPRGGGLNLLNIVPSSISLTVPSNNTGMSSSMSYDAPSGGAMICTIGGALQVHSVARPAGTQTLPAPQIAAISAGVWAGSQTSVPETVPSPQTSVEGAEAEQQTFIG